MLEQPVACLQDYWHVGIFKEGGIFVERPSARVGMTALNSSLYNPTIYKICKARLHVY